MTSLYNRPRTHYSTAAEGGGGDSLLLFPVSPQIQKTNNYTDCFLKNWFQNYFVPENWSRFCNEKIGSKEIVYREIGPVLL